MGLGALAAWGASAGLEALGVDPTVAAIAGIVAGMLVYGGLNALDKKLGWSAKAAVKPPKGCFVAGTLIATATGLKPIEEIHFGELVLSKDESTGEIGYKPVVEAYVHDDITELLHLTVNGDKIVTTPNHPFWVNGKWIEAGDLQIGDNLSLANDDEAIVSNIEFEKLKKPVAVYNFQVADWHTYFVGEIGVWVHNKAKASKQSGKSRATNAPSYAKHYTPKAGETAKQFAERVMNTQFGEGNWKPGSGSDYNKVYKYASRHLGLK